MTQTEYLNQQPSDSCDIFPTYLTKIAEEAQFYGQRPFIAQGILHVDFNYLPILIVLVDNTLPFAISNEMLHPRPLEMQTVGTPKQDSKCIHLNGVNIRYLAPKRIAINPEKGFEL